ncbi:MAG: hypothetical protein Alis3KO_41190 [Aliiglaciecola sp.]
MKRLLFALILLPFFVEANGTYIVKNAVITSIANTSGNSEKFTIWVEGGSGSCANSIIVFPRTAASSDEIYSRAYSAALTAFTSGKKIWVHNYEGDQCNNASYIRLFN